MKQNNDNLHSKNLFAVLISMGFLLGSAWVPFSDNSLIKNAHAVIGRPATPGSVAGVARRTSRRTTRRVYHRHAVGHRLTVLPVGYTMMVIAGVTYYHHAGVYYKPYYEGTQVVYVVVDNPKR